MLFFFFLDKDTMPDVPRKREKGEFIAARSDAYLVCKSLDPMDTDDMDF